MNEGPGFADEEDPLCADGIIGWAKELIEANDVSGCPYGAIPRDAIGIKGVKLGKFCSPYMMQT